MAQPLLQAQIDVEAPLGTATATRLVKTRRANHGVKTGSNLVVGDLFGGVRSFENELIEGMNASLSRIKAAAER